MPDLTGNATTYRAGRETHQVYLSVLPRTVIFSRAINQATFTYPVTTLTFDNAYSGTGATSDVKVGQTVLVYNQNTSTLKGMLRVAAGGTSSTVLQINEVSQGTIDFADNDRLDICAEWNLFDVLVSASAAFNKDSRITYTSQLSDPPPICNSGGPVAGFVDDTTGLLTVNFYGSTSFRVDPDAGSITAHSWTFPSGTPSTSSAANPTGVTFPASSTPYIVTHTITDSNGTTSTQYVPVWAVDRSANKPLSVRGLTITKGVSAEFEAADATTAALSMLPDKSMIVLWEKQRYAGTLASYGSNVATDRSNIKFVGYLDTESVQITADDSGVYSTVTFQATSGLGVLNKLGALPQLMVSTTSPTKWTQIKSLTVWRALWYILYWHATWNLINDFLWPSAGDLAYARIAVQNIASIGGQLKDVADSINVDVTCDALGRLLLVQNPNYLSLTDRSSRTTTYNFTTQDIRELTIPRTHWRPVKFVRGSGILSSATIVTQAVFSNAPGNAPAEGSGSEQFARKIISTQTEMNRLTGEHYAYLNSLWYDETTKAISGVPKGATMLLPDGYDWLDPAYREWITLTLASATNLRGATYSTATRWLPQTVTVRYGEDGGKEVEVQFDHETHGPPAVTYVPPTKADTSTPVVTPPDITFPGGTTYTPPTLYPYGWLPGANTLAVFTATGVWITNNFNTPSAAGGPTWTFTTIAYGGGQSARSFVVDPISPRYIGTGTAVNGWVRSATHVYRVTDIFGSIAVSSEVTFTGSQADWGIDFSFGAGGAGLWGVSVWLAVNQIVASYTTNGGTSWAAQAAITANTMTISLDTGLFISSNTGNAYASAVNGSGSSDIYKIDSSGLTWASFLAVGSTNNIGAIVVPFFNNAADTYLYFHKRTSTSTTNGDHLMRYDGSTQTDISPVVSGTNYCPLVNESINQSSRWKMSIPSNSRTKMLLVAQSANGVGPSAVFATQNLEDATPTWTTVIAPGSSTFRFGVLADDGQSAYLWGGNGGSPKVAYTGNVWDGSGVDDRTGNMVDNAGQGTPLGICGG